MFTVTYEARDQEGFNTIDQLLRKDPDAVAEALKRYEVEKAGPASQSNFNILAQLSIPNDAELKRILDTHIPVRLEEEANSLAKAQEAFVRSHLTSPSEAFCVLVLYDSPRIRLLCGRQVSYPTTSRQ